MHKLKKTSPGDESDQSVSISLWLEPLAVLFGNTVFQNPEMISKPSFDFKRQYCRFCCWQLGRGSRFTY